MGLPAPSIRRRVAPPVRYTGRPIGRQGVPADVAIFDEDDGTDLFGAVVVAEIVDTLVEDTFISTDTTFDTE